MKVLSQIPGTDETIMVQGEVQPVLLLLSEDDIKVIRNMPEDNRWYLQYPGESYTAEAMQDWVEEVQGWVANVTDQQDINQLDGMKENLENMHKEDNGIDDVVTLDPSPYPHDEVPNEVPTPDGVAEVEKIRENIGANRGNL